MVFVGAKVDTKNALRTFLTSSSDFSSDPAARQRESTAPVTHANSPLVTAVTVTTDTRNCPPPVPAFTASLRAAHHSADLEARSASNNDVAAGHSLPASRVETAASIQKSPRPSAPCLPAAAIFPTITDIARFNINSTGHPPMAVPFLVAGPPAVEPAIRGRQIFGTLAVTSVPQPPTSLSSIVLPAGFVAGTALRLPVAPVQSRMNVITTMDAASHGEPAVRSPISSQATTTDEDLIGARVDQSEHQDVSSAVNWKLKMARDHVSDSEFTLIISSFLFRAVILCEYRAYSKDHYVFFKLNFSCIPVVGISAIQNCISFLCHMFCFHKP